MSRLIVSTLFFAAFLWWAPASAASPERNSVEDVARARAMAEFQEWRATIPDLERRQYDRIKTIQSMMYRHSTGLVVLALLQLVTVGALIWIIKELKALRKVRHVTVVQRTDGVAASEADLSLSQASDKAATKADKPALPSFRTLATRIWRPACVIIFNVFVLLVLFNGGFYLILPPQSTHEVNFEKQEAWKQMYTIEMLRTVYPGKSDDEIIAKTRQVYGTGVTYEPFIQVKTEPGILGPATAAGVHEEGFRLNGPRQAPWPPDPKAFNIFVFGGSTTIGSGVADNETIPAHLQDILRDGNQSGRLISTYNFGAPGYFSLTERAFLERELLRGYRPDMVVFIDGYNDNHIWRGEPGMTWWFRNQFPEWMKDKAVQEPSWYIRRSIEQMPIVLWLKSLQEKPTLATFGTKFDGGRFPPGYLEDKAKIDAIIARYVRNKAMIESMGKEFGFIPVFVWQPTSTYKFDGPLPTGKMDGEGLRTKWGYPAMRDYADQNPLGRNFLWCADIQEGSKAILYVDAGIHYSSEGGRMLARCIADGLKKEKLLEAARTSK